ncbi:MAG: hypothetical protein LBI12_03120, partial [Treponema sp.]|nr:hypothetical protein [Treponema sp.]
MKFTRFAVLLIFPFFAAGFFSCGIEEYYYLPQVPKNSIPERFNTEADINLPAILEHYGSHYTIFYRIYVSNLPNGSKPELSQISPALANDYAFFDSFTNPTNTSNIPSDNTFRNRNYFELEFNGGNVVDVLPKTGGNISIHFPTGSGFPIIKLVDSGDNLILLRSSELVDP